MSQQPLTELQAMIGKQVVLDTDSSFIYIGYLEKVGAEFVALAKVDVHDTNDSKSTKEAYTHETKKLGERYNRQLTYVRLARIVSISLLDDVVSF